MSGTEQGRDPFEYFDAAYLFGALDAADRAAFETHLPTCAECRARLEELRPTVGLLTEARDDGAGAPTLDEPPDTLLPGLLRRAAREQRRRRLVTSGLGALAAACLVALAIVVWVGRGDDAANPPRQALTPLQPVQVTATAVLASKPWGTEIRLRCVDEPKPSGAGGGMPYRLIVVDAANKKHDAGSWLASPTGTTNFVGGTEVTRERIVKVQVTLEDGRPILQLKL